MRVGLVRTSRRPPWPVWVVVVVAAWLALVAAAVALAAAADVDVHLCLFHRLTTLPCPTCGSTRGTLSILHGEFVAGWAKNPMLFTLMLAAAAALLLRVALARKVEVQMSRSERRVAIGVFLVLLAVNWAYVIRYVG